MIKRKKTALLSIILTSIFSLAIPTSVYASTSTNSNKKATIVQQDNEFYLRSYQALYNESNSVYGTVDFNNKVTSRNTRAFFGSIENETLDDYFSSCRWIKRNNILSLSLQPKSKLLKSGNPNGNVLSARASHAFNLLRQTYRNSPYWRNTASMEAQFHCHVLLAGGFKTPWNIEPHRTESNWKKVMSAKCNP